MNKLELFVAGAFWALIFVGGTAWAVAHTLALRALL
jgi:hypothetical protein